MEKERGINQQGKKVGVACTILSMKGRKEDCFAQGKMRMMKSMGVIKLRMLIRKRPCISKRADSEWKLRRGETARRPNVASNKKARIGKRIKVYYG